MPETERRVQKLERGLTLVNTAGIKFGENLITPEVIQEDVEKWYGWALTPEIGRLEEEDEIILRELLIGSMPLAIIGASQEIPLVLNAELKRFPYSIDENRSFEAFSLRLVPEQGSVTSVILGEGHSVAIGSQKISPESLSVDLGNSFHLEIYFEKEHPEDLPPLVAPERFHERVILARPSSN